MRKTFIFSILCIGVLFLKVEKKEKRFYILKDKGGVCVVGRQHDLVSHTCTLREHTLKGFLYDTLG